MASAVRTAAGKSSVSHDWEAFRRAAIELCHSRGTELTTLRESVLAELWAADKPLGAYGLADRMTGRNGCRLAANSVYRILMVFQSFGLIRRIESQHAYCILDQADADANILLLCDDCGGVAAISDTGVRAMVNARSRALGFHSARQVIEVLGRCHECDSGAVAHG